MLVMEMLGRGLALEPYLPSVVLCGGLIRDAGSAAQKEALLPAIAGGELMLAFAHFEAGGRYALDHVATQATPGGGGWKLDGAKAVVLAAPSARQVHRFRARRPRAFRFSWSTPRRPD
jgi:alkylation response protein AidB-like acyl-CoA dehydrogenase